MVEMIIGASRGINAACAHWFEAGKFPDLSVRHAPKVIFVCM